MTTATAAMLPSLPLPAGALTVQGVNLSNDYPVVTVRGQNGVSVQVLVLRLSASTGNAADKIWLAGVDSGCQVLAGAPRR